MYSEMLYLETLRKLCTIVTNDLIISLITNLLVQNQSYLALITI